MLHEEKIPHISVSIVTLPFASAKQTASASVEVSFTYRKARQYRAGTVTTTEVIGVMWTFFFLLFFCKARKHDFVHARTTPNTQGCSAYTHRVPLGTVTKAAWPGWRYSRTVRANFTPTPSVDCVPPAVWAWKRKEGSDYWLCCTVALYVAPRQTSDKYHWREIYSSGYFLLPFRNALCSYTTILQFNEHAIQFFLYYILIERYRCIISSRSTFLCL